MYVNGLALKSKIILTIVLDPQMKNHGTVLSSERGWLVSLTNLWKEENYSCLIWFFFMDVKTLMEVA